MKVPKGIIFLTIFSVFVCRDMKAQGWQIINSGTSASINSMCFVDTSLIFAAADTGKVLRSSNGGITWNIIQCGTILPLRGVSFVNKDTGYTVAGSQLLRTSNSGLNWMTVSSFYGNCYFVKFFSKYSGVVITSYNINFQYYIDCYRTSNGGNNWNSSTVTTGYLSLFNNVFFLDSLYGYIAVAYLMSVTTNGGNTWSTHNIGSNNDESYIYNFVSPDTGFLVLKSTNINVQMTTNRGSTFNPIYQTTAYNLYAGYFLNQNTGYIAGVSGPILCTTNKGVNWITQYPASIPNGLSRMLFINERLGFTFGAHGTIMRTSNGGGLFIGITQNSSGIPSNYSLYQNSPNPFNPHTKIKFDLSYKSIARISLFNIQGKEITILVNNEMDAGSYSVDWDATNYPSGVYFYKLTAGKFSETKKMILIK